MEPLQLAVYVMHHALRGASVAQAGLSTFMDENLDPDAANEQPPEFQWAFGLSLEIEDCKEKARGALNELLRELGVPEERIQGDGASDEWRTDIDDDNLDTLLRFSGGRLRREEDEDVT